MSTLIENLLYQSEGTALDFKKEQYPFAKATDEQKSELLKDILAFANSWRQDDAYIVIGVQEVQGGRHISVGTEEHFDDSRLQQFINGKTNRKVKFAYEIHVFEGNKFGIIRIPKQERPIYATKNYGKVKKEAVYYRLGSSTVIANPDDIARMGRDSIQNIVTPVIDLQFVDLNNRHKLGNCIEIFSTCYQRPKLPIPDYHIKQSYNVGGYFIPMPMTQSVNSSYWRDKEEYIRLINLLKPVAFVVQNKSNVLAENIKVELLNHSSNNIHILDELPSKPYSDSITNATRFIRPIGKPKSPIDVAYHGDIWTLSINFGSVQPKSDVWLAEPFFLGAIKQERFETEAIIYADNIPEPQKINMSVDFTVENKSTLTVKDLKNMPPFD